MHITLYPGARAPTPARVHDMPWDDAPEAIREWLATTPPRPVERDGARDRREEKARLLALAPHRLRPGTARADANVDAVTAIVIDVDACDLDALDAAIRASGWAAIVYGSPSDDAGADVRRVRVLSPVTRELDPRECDDARLAFAERLGLTRGCGVEGALGASRLFFVGALHGDPPREMRVYPGAPVDVDALPAPSPAWRAVPDRDLAPACGDADAPRDIAREAAAHAIASTLGSWRDHPGRKWHVAVGVGGLLRKLDYPAALCEQILRVWLDGAPADVDVEHGVSSALRAWDRLPEEVRGIGALREVLPARTVATIEAAALLPLRAGVLTRDNTNAANAAPTGASDYGVGTAIEWSDTIEPVEYTIEGLRLAPSDGKVSVVFGAPNAGKGPLAGLIGTALALGQDVLGHRATHRKRVLLLDFEGWRLTRRRIARMARGYGADPRDLDGYLTLIDAREVTDTICEGYHDGLRRLCDDGGYDAVIVDSYTSATLGTGLNPNAPEYALLARALGRLDRLVLCVGHTSKSSDGQPGLRDLAHTGALAAMVSTAIAVYKPDPEDEYRIRISCARAPETGFAAIDARYEDLDDGGLVLRAIDAGDATAATPETRANQHTLRARADRRIASRRVMAAMRGAPGQWVSRANLLASAGKGATASKDALAGLVERGYLEHRVAVGRGEYALTEQGAATSDEEIEAALGWMAE